MFELHQALQKLILTYFGIKKLNTDRPFDTSLCDLFRTNNRKAVITD